MPHKVNPIDFENAEANLGISTALLEHLSTKLPVSRLQRDLSDSSASRNIGPAIGHACLALKSILNGLGKVAIDKQAIASDLENAWEILGEAVQTVMRKAGYENAYEHMKDLTRGHRDYKERSRQLSQRPRSPPRRPQKPEKPNAPILHRACPATCG